MNGFIIIAMLASMGIAAAVAIAALITGLILYGVADLIKKKTQRRRKK